MSTLILSRAVPAPDSSRKSWIPHPLPGEKSLQHFLGGKWSPGKTNFLDNNFGSLFTPALFGGAVLISDLKWPQGCPGKDAVEDGFLLFSGLMATEGLTDIFKNAFARPRPFLEEERNHPDLERASKDFAEDHRSFFSGHASSSFFAAGYANKRIRAIMRQRMSEQDYRHWRWVPPVALFGWSTFVDYTRIRAYKHYFSDVAVGSAVGYALSELFFRFGNNVQLDYARKDGHAPALCIDLRF